MNIKWIAWTILSISLLSFRTQAQDRLFTYTYQSGVLNQGQREIEVWNTFNFQRVNFYRAYKHKIEFEVGLGKNLQTAFYLNLAGKAYYDTTSSGIINSGTEISFSNEWKYKILDPVADPIGLAIYGELGLSADEFSLEWKLILDKKIGKTTHAFNVVAEPEWVVIAKETMTTSEFGLTMELDYGFSYAISHNLNLGLELRNHNIFHPKDEHSTNSKYELESSALFGGPVISYSQGNFWINLTVLPQLTALYHYNDHKPMGKILDEHEKLETRLIFSYVF